MVKNYQENVQLVISHQEGSGGNFLARIYANRNLGNQPLYRTDIDMHPAILATGNIENLHWQLQKLYYNHNVIVTHCQELLQLQYLFPRAKILQIYPYTHIGNVLYNISTKKLRISMSNTIDNHLIHISEWYAKIQKDRPQIPCIDYWELTDSNRVQEILDIEFDQNQYEFFQRYWAAQLPLELNWPDTQTSIAELLNLWKVTEFNEWLAAWTIFVYESVNLLKESDRTWSIDSLFENWADIKNIQGQYSRNFDKHTETSI